jgi:hypothetical protein
VGQDRDQWRALVKTEIEYSGSIKGGKLIICSMESVTYCNFSYEENSSPYNFEVNHMCG